MPELLDSINIARGCGELQKLLKAYKKVDAKIGARATSARSLSHTFPEFQPNPAGHEPHRYKTCRGWAVNPLTSAGYQSQLYFTGF